MHLNSTKISLKNDLHFTPDECKKLFIRTLVQMAPSPDGPSLDSAYLERKRISLQKDVDSKVRLELINSIENLRNEDDENVFIVHPSWEDEDPHQIEDNNIDSENDIDIGDI